MSEKLKEHLNNIIEDANKQVKICFEKEINSDDEIYKQGQQEKKQYHLGRISVCEELKKFN